VRVSLRHMSDNTFSIVLRKPVRSPKPGDPAYENEVIANVDAISAPELVYPEAVYLHNGESYFVRTLDLVGKVAYVERHEMDYYTQAVLESTVRIKDQRQGSETPAGLLAFGDVDVTWQTVAFKKIKFGTRENIGQGPVDIPEQTLPTTALWLLPSDAIRREMKVAGLRTSEGIAGLRNLVIVALPMVAMCDSRDLSGVVDSGNLGRSTMILYDRYPGGLGYTEKGFQHFARLLQVCREMVSECGCEEGCPSCVGLPNLRPAIHSDPDLSRGYPTPNKAATLRLTELLCDALQAEPLESSYLRASL
jgi:DEAD/DEAH box helicase domain-containing protein